MNATIFFMFTSKNGNSNAVSEKKFFQLLILFCQRFTLFIRECNQLRKKSDLKSGCCVLFLWILSHRRLYCHYFLSDQNTEWNP